MKGLAISRRVVIRGGALAVGLAVGGGLWRAVDQGVFAAGQGPAFEPWRTWQGRPDEGPLALVRAAILAANPHNSQPWMFRVTPRSIDLFADRHRHLGAIDPLGREMDIGLGCALENLVLAAAARGWTPRVEALPTAADPAHVARVELVSAAPAGSDLYHAIPARHTYRGPFDRGRSVGPDVRGRLEIFAGDSARLVWFTTEAERRRIGDVIVLATEAIVADGEQSQVTPQWLRSRWRDVQVQRDGLTIDTNVSPAYMRVLAKLGPPVSSERGDAFWLASTREIVVPSAAGFGILAVREPHDRGQRLAGGRAWQRLQLGAASMGLALQPLSQMTERADREQTTGGAPRFGHVLHELVGDPTWQALMTFRFGHPTEPPALSPRRPVEWVVA
jgi:nitroreductase